MITIRARYDGKTYHFRSLTGNRRDAPEAGYAAAAASGRARRAGHSRQAGQQNSRPARTARPTSTTNCKKQGRFEALYNVSRLLGSSLDVQMVLNQVMDAIIQLTKAERGFLMLRDDDGEMVVKAARNLDQQTLSSDKFEFSRTISQSGAGLRQIGCHHQRRRRPAFRPAGEHRRPRRCAASWRLPCACAAK